MVHTPPPPRPASVFAALSSVGRLRACCADVSAPEAGRRTESAGGTAPGAFRAIAKDSPAAAEAAQAGGQIEEQALAQARAAAAAVEQDVDDDAPPDLDF
jgi:hypothetical protein